ncbi:uncharacterized protein LOC111620144 isoform X2 [Centruroides sculpturatus]|nr:uncharacterized protein LOC111620144 isoform X2 [Centruroides sculpturatus]
MTDQRIEVENLKFEPMPWIKNENLSVTLDIIVTKDIPCTAMMSIVFPQCGKELTSEDKSFDFDMLTLFKSPCNKIPDENCPCEETDPFKMATGGRIIGPREKYTFFLIPPMLPEGCYDMKVILRVPDKTKGVVDIFCLDLLEFEVAP